MSDRYRFIDLDEQPFVVLIDTYGTAEIIGDDAVCKAKAAAVLTVVADVLAGEHTGQCFPSADAPSHSRSIEPLHTHASTLDAAARVWTDGTGHAWDLSLSWGDASGRAWSWRGILDSRGAPLMRSADDAEVRTLDVLRVESGPISPLSGGAA